MKKTTTKAPGRKKVRGFSRGVNHFLSSAAAFGGKEPVILCPAEDLQKFTKRLLAFKAGIAFASMKKPEHAAKLMKAQQEMASWQISLCDAHSFQELKDFCEGSSCSFILIDRASRFHVKPEEFMRLPGRKMVFDLLGHSVTIL